MTENIIMTNEDRLRRVKESPLHKILEEIQDKKRKKELEEKMEKIERIGTEHASSLASTETLPPIKE